MKILVSACLLGTACRYDGKSAPNQDVLALSAHHTLIPLCPEQLGGLPTPRVPSERVGERVVSREGVDVTGAYLRGTDEVLRLCTLFGIKLAILKERSPACGSGMIYDGTFSGTLRKGDGILAGALKEAGITVIGESAVPSCFSLAETAFSGENEEKSDQSGAKSKQPS